MERKYQNTKSKKASDLTNRHFSRYGEFLASFQLSKYGWNVYDPVYDEYIDFVIHKHICSDCGKNWNMTPLLVCKKCGKDFSTGEKKKIIPIICNDCYKTTKGNKSKCSKCGSNNISKKPICDKCSGEVEMIKYSCDCGSLKYKTKFRTIQVKSSRIETKPNGSSKNTYAIDMEPKDLIEDNFHFFIWCLVDDNEKPHFLVMSVRDFSKTMGNSIKTVAFLKDQDRQHFSSINFGKWEKFYNNFEILE